MPEGTGVYFSHCSYAEIGKMPVTCKQAKTNVHMLAAALPAQICIAYMCMHLHVIANLYDFLSSMELKRRYFEECLSLKRKIIQNKMDKNILCSSHTWSINVE